MQIKELEIKLNELEHNIRPDMYDSFEEYINEYRVAFYDLFGSEPCEEEPAFIEEAREFLKINHDVLRNAGVNGNMVDFEYLKNKKLLDAYYSKSSSNEYFIPELTDDDIERIMDQIEKLKLTDAGKNRFVTYEGGNK